MVEVSPNLNTIPSFGLDLSKENNLPSLDIWDEQFYIDSGGDSGSDYLLGSVFDGEYIYQSESNSAEFHYWDMDLNYMGSFYPSGLSTGIMDMCWDSNEEVAWGAAYSGCTLYKLDLANQEVLDTISLPASSYNVAYDSDDDAFWIGQWSYHLTKIDKDGNVLDEIPVPESMLGMAYDNTVEWDGYNGPFLWIFTGTSSYPSTPAVIKCIDIDSKELIPDLEFDVTELYGGGIAGGLAMTYLWDSSISVLMGSVQGVSNDYVFGFEISWYWPHDVGVKNIVSPEDCDASEDMEVIVQVRNYGYHIEEDISVNVIILKVGVDEEYNETEYVDVIYPGESVFVEMPSWTPDDWQNVSNEYIDYKITAQVTLWGDDKTSNDYIEKCFELYFSYFHDVGCIGISGPESGPAQTFIVNATIKNFGQYDECCFKTYVEIAELDIENQVELLTEDFTDYPFPPTGWTRTHSNWMYSDSSYAGGSSGEARFNCSTSSTDIFRLHTSAIDTNDYSVVEIEFKHYVDHFETPYALQVETSVDGVNWDVVWDIDPIGNVGPETITILTAQNVGSTTYMSWTFNGNSSNIDSWYVDDVVIIGYTSLDPEYEDDQCITVIDPGEELVLEFDDWTPVYLAEETSGIKKYSVIAWTEMDVPPDENPDNDLFANFIKLDFFHDVGVREIILTFQKGSCIYNNCWCTVDCNINDFVNWCESGIELLAPTDFLFPHDGALTGGHLFSCFTIPYTIPFYPDRYVLLGSHNIDTIVENTGTFPEFDLTSYVEIYEYITNCTNGIIVFENNITDIDLDEPLGGTEMLNFGSYNFANEGLYGLFLSLPDDNDDYPINNEVCLGVGADGTPPVSNHSLDPETPDGENGWYVSDIELTICAKDPSIGCGHPGSGVREIRVRINGGSWQVYEVECVTIIIDEDDSNILIEYYAIDNVGNSGSIKSLTVQRDTTKPDIVVGWEISRVGFTWYARFICRATDETSDIDIVKMYINDEFYENNTGTGPIYEFVIVWSGEVNTSMFKFVAFDKAGNSNSDFVNGSDIISHSRSQSSITHRSINILFLRFLERFPLLERLLSLIRVI